MDQETIRFVFESLKSPEMDPQTKENWIDERNTRKLPTE